jgi:hypothetical protein
VGWQDLAAPKMNLEWRETKFIYHQNLQEIIDRTFSPYITSFLNQWINLSCPPFVVKNISFVTHRVLFWKSHRNIPYSKYLKIFLRVYIELVVFRFLCKPNNKFYFVLQFALLLWVLTYIGSWFNGMTLIIMGM